MNSEEKKELADTIDYFDSICKEKTMMYYLKEDDNRLMMYRQSGVVPPEDGNYTEEYRKEVTDNILKDLVENSFDNIYHYKEAKSEFGLDKDGTTYLKLWVPVTFKSSTKEVVKKKSTKTNMSIIKSLSEKEN